MIKNCISNLLMIIGGQSVDEVNIFNSGKISLALIVKRCSDVK